MKEPFLINPPIKKKKIKSKKKKTKKIKKIIKKFYLKRRSNPMSELLLLNPKKSKKSSSRKKPKKHRMVVYGTVGNVMISPKSILAPKSRGRIINPVVKYNDINAVLGISAGFVASRIVPKFFEQNLPSQLQVGLGKIAVQTATGLGISFVVGNVLKKKEFGKLMLYGTLLNTAISLIDNYILKGQLSAEGLSTLMDTTEQEANLKEGENEITISENPEDEIVSNTDEADLIDLSDEQPIIIT